MNLDKRATAVIVSWTILVPFSAEIVVFRRLVLRIKFRWRNGRSLAKRRGGGARKVNSNAERQNVLPSAEHAHVYFDFTRDGDGSGRAWKRVSREKNGRKGGETQETENVWVSTHAFHAIEGTRMPKR